MAGLHLHSESLETEATERNGQKWFELKVDEGPLDGPTTVVVFFDDIDLTIAAVSTLESQLLALRGELSL